MHVDAKGTVGQYPVLLVRTTLRHLRSRMKWGLAELQAAAGLAPGSGRALVRVLRAEGLIEAVGREIWSMTQAGVTFSAATAAQQVTRATAERTLSEFLERVTEVNQNPYFLAKVTTVVLFGSMLKPEVERLSDVDVAVELARKEPDFDRAQGQNQQRAEELANASGTGWSGRAAGIGRRSGSCTGVPRKESSSKASRANPLNSRRDPRGHFCDLGVTGPWT